MAQVLTCDTAWAFIHEALKHAVDQIFVSSFQCFAGAQNVSGLQKDEAWKVNVRIHGYDLKQGYLCGTMEALNVPLADTPVSNLSILSLEL
jgi:hypothetical protein